MIAAGPSGSPYTIFVNTSDGFEDCWDPFFTLLQRYWSLATAPVMLNTELKSWAPLGMNIHCTQVQLGQEERLSWSECLLRGLDQVRTPLILYFQEDYFIDRPVDHARIEAAVNHMAQHPEVGHVALTAFGSHGPHLPYSTPGMQMIRPKARYRISTQAGLWRVDTLKSYLRPAENGWMFEICGSWRAHRRSDTFLVMSHGECENGPPIHYLHTGIIKGKWLPEIATVFRNNGISVDYSRRGFYRHKSTLARRLETARKLMANPVYLLQQWL